MDSLWTTVRPGCVTFAVGLSVHKVLAEVIKALLITRTKSEKKGCIQNNHFIIIIIRRLDMQHEKSPKNLHSANVYAAFLF